MTNEKINVIIDTDPGVDDSAAIALSLYDDLMDIKLISTVCGNKDVNTVTRNALHILELFDRTDIPVSKGSGKALCRFSPDASDVHKASGMGGYTPPQTTNTQPIKLRAVDAIYQTVKQYAGNVVLICLGPLTNIAKLMYKHPDVKTMINRIYTEGSSSVENGITNRWTEHKSFNASTDPEAVYLVLNSGIPITYIPSEMGREMTYFSDEDVAKMATINDVGKFLAKMYSGYWERGYNDKRVATNDTCAILAMRFPDLFKTVKTSFSINMDDDPGKTTVVEDPNGNVDFAVNIDREKFKEYFFRAIKKLDRFTIPGVNPKNPKTTIKKSTNAKETTKKMAL